MFLNSKDTVIHVLMFFLLPVDTLYMWLSFRNILKHNRINTSHKFLN